VRFIGASGRIARKLPSAAQVAPDNTHLVGCVMGCEIPRTELGSKT